MSNDTGWSLFFRHKDAEFLSAISQYILVEKPKRCRELEKLQKKLPQEKWDDPSILEELNAISWNEVITWEGFWEFEKIEAHENLFSMKASSWANENVSNIHIAGKEGELADVKKKFPGVKIEGSFMDEYSIGILNWNLEKKYQFVHLLDDQNWWREKMDVFYDDSKKPIPDQNTRELWLRIEYSFLNHRRIRALIKEGADFKSVYFERTLDELLLDLHKWTVGRGKVLDILIQSGLNIHNKDNFRNPDYCNRLIYIARDLHDSKGAKSARLRLAQHFAQKKVNLDNWKDLLLEGINDKKPELLVAAATLHYPIKPIVESLKPRKRNYFYKAMGFQ